MIICARGYCVAKCSSTGSGHFDRCLAWAQSRGFHRLATQHFVLNKSTITVNPILFLLEIIRDSASAPVLAGNSLSSHVNEELHKVLHGDCRCWSFFDEWGFFLSRTTILLNASSSQSLIGHSIIGSSSDQFSGK